MLGAPHNGVLREWSANIPTAANPSVHPTFAAGTGSRSASHRGRLGYGPVTTTDSDEHPLMRKEIVDGLVAKGANRECLECLPETALQTLLLWIALHGAVPRRNPRDVLRAKARPAFRFS